jgi:amino acid transporter
MSGAAGEMRNPARDVPRAILSAGILITALYLGATLSLLTVVPLENLSLVNGILDGLYSVFGESPGGTALVKILGCTALFAIFATLVTWTLGVNRVAAEAARAGELPGPFGLLLGKNRIPLGASLLSGTISTVILVVYGFLAGTSEELFWTLTAFASILFLLPYGVLFPAFLRLRRRDGEARRPYRIPGPFWFVFLAAGIADLFVLQSILLFVWVPGRPFDGNFAAPVILGVFLTGISGELLIRRAERSPSKRA